LYLRGIELAKEVIKNIVHLGFVVHDVDETMKKLVDLLGMKPWNIWTMKPPFLRDITVHGKEVSHGFRAAIAQLENTAIELLAPLEGESVYKEYLEKKGEGFHHVAVAVPSEEELEKIVKELKEKGCEVIQSGRLGDLALYYYVDIKEIGLVIELFTGTVPPPERSYP